MKELNEMCETISAAGQLQDMIDRILISGVVPRWLPLRAACFYSGIREKKMLNHVENGDIYGTLDGGKWIIDRLSIDNYFLLTNKKVENIIANITAKR